MDFDGDRILATKDKRIWEAICDITYIIYDTGIKSDKVRNTWANRLDFFVKTSVPDKTGYITNLATKWADLAHNYRLIGRQDMADRYDCCVIALRFLQGWEIDSAKTGKNAEAIGFPKSLKEAKTPHHFIGMRELQKRDVNVKEEDVYVSHAAMGYLYDYVKEYRKNHINVEAKTQSMLVYLSSLFTREELEAVDEIWPVVLEIEKSYRKSVANISEIKDSMDKGAFMNSLSAIYDKYQNQVYSLINAKYTERIVTYAAYYVSYNRRNNETDSRSFPWNCLFDSMIMLLSEMDNEVRMYRIPERLINTEKEIDSCRIENFNLIINDKILGTVPCNKDMPLTITVIDDKPFVVVPVTEKEVKEEVKEMADMDKTFGLSISGFRYTTAVHCENFLEAVKANNNVFDIVYENEELAIKINGIKYGNVASQSALSAMANTRVVLVSHGVTTHAAKRITKNTLMKDDVMAYNGQIDVEVTPLELIGEDMTKNGYCIANKAAEQKSYSHQNVNTVTDDMLYDEAAFGMFEGEYVQTISVAEVDGGMIPDDYYANDNYGSDIMFDDDFDMI